jgi:hypothetical protein
MRPPRLFFANFSVAGRLHTICARAVEPERLPDASAQYGEESGPSADARDPVVEVFKRDIDFTLVERNLQLSIEQRAQQLVNATRFLGRFRPLVAPTGR